jgi:hypothetical protein
MTKICKKFTDGKKLIFLKSKTAIYLSLGHHKERPSKLQKKPSALKREHPALQNMKFLNFFHFFGVIFALLDPDPIRNPGQSSYIIVGSETFPEVFRAPDLNRRLQIRFLIRIFC